MGWAVVATAVQLSNAGCASTYAIAPGAKTASFQVETRDAPRGAIARRVHIWAFADENCRRHPRGLQVGASAFSDEQQVAITDPVQIAADETFVVTGSFSDGRDAQRRVCFATVGFTPLAGHDYKAILTVIGAVNACRMDVFDRATAGYRRIDVSIPHDACERPDPLAIHQPVRLNGQAVWTTYHVEFY